ncbi:MAG: hypothetical protein U0W24_14720 [Bacteroidales bacterium]
MNTIKLSKIFAMVAILIIAVIFLSVISPLKGLSIFTWPLIMIGILLWIISIALFIIGLVVKKPEKTGKTSLILPVFAILCFIPFGIFSIKMSGKVRTQITVNVINESDYEASNILIYGTGNIFEGCDTLKLSKLEKGAKIQYIINPDTGPGRKGFIRMECDFEKEHVAKDIAGEFSINPYQIQQEWIVNIGNDFN